MKSINFHCSHKNRVNCKRLGTTIRILEEAVIRPNSMFNFCTFRVHIHTQSCKHNGAKHFFDGSTQAADEGHARLLRLQRRHRRLYQRLFASAVIQSENTTRM